jgi:sulfonate transport system substrate-binding protein
MKIHATRRAVLFAATVLMMGSGMATAAETIKELRVDYATYSPTSLIVRKMGWMEEEFKADNIPVKWVFSQGSANALDFLKKGSVDFSSSAGLAAVLARASGSPVRGVYIYSKPEWAALTVGKDSPIQSVKDLKGKKIAATPGTDPYIFVMRALQLHGLSKDDVEMMPMAHLLGRKALENKEVDAWGALDPHMAASMLEAGTKVIYRNPDFCSFGFLNTTDAFATANPQVVKRVIKVYEKARAWAASNPDELVKLMVEEAKISADVAKAQLKRNDFSNPVPGAEQIKALKAGVPTLVAAGLLPTEVAANKAIDELVDGSFAKGLK